MIPIVECPSVVTSSIPLFKDVFSKPQKNNFSKYVSGLILSPNHTIAYVNSLFYSHGDQTALNNFITDSTWSDADLDKARYRLIIDGLNEKEDTDARGDGILIVDDSLAHHTGKQIEFSGKYFDHSAQTYTLAHDVLSTHIVKGRVSMPLDFDIYLKKDQLSEKYLLSTGREKDEASRKEHAKQLLRELQGKFKDKNQMARDLITKAGSREVPFSLVLGDSWFFCRTTVELIESLDEKKKDWIFGVKSDRVVQMVDGWKSLSEWAKTISREKFQLVKVWYEKKLRLVWAYAKALVMRSLGNKKVMVVATYDNPDLNGDPNFYCSNRTDWNEYKILKLYAKRWRIDAFYRDAKQNLGFEDYEMRKIEGVRRHLSMVFIAHTLLVLGSGVVSKIAAAAVDDNSTTSTTAAATAMKKKLRSSKISSVVVGKAGACLETIGSLCRMAYDEVLLSFVNLVLELARKNRKTDARKIVRMVRASKQELRLIGR